MKTTIDAAGRLVIPKQIRQRAGLVPGATVDVRWTEGRIEIEPATLPVKLVRRGRFLLPIPQVDVEPLTDEAVEETRQALLDERLQDLISEPSS